MSEMIACCGLPCHACPIYLATRMEDRKERASLRARIAALLNEHYGISYRPEDITDCDGCQTEKGRLFVGCNLCGIRKCALQKGIETCAHCADYICEKLQVFFSTEPEAKTRLDEVRCSFSSAYENRACSIPQRNTKPAHPESKPKRKSD